MALYEVYILAIYYDEWEHSNRVSLGIDDFVRFGDLDYLLPEVRVSGMGLWGWSTKVGVFSSNYSKHYALRPVIYFPRDKYELTQVDDNSLEISKRHATN